MAGLDLGTELERWGVSIHEVREVYDGADDDTTTTTT